MKEKQVTMNYETPKVKVIEVEVEKGYAASGDPTGDVNEMSRG